MKNKLIKLLGGYTQKQLQYMIYIAVQGERERWESAIIKTGNVGFYNKMLIKNLDLPDYDTFTDGWRER